MKHAKEKSGRGVFVLLALVIALLLGAVIVLAVKVFLLPGEETGLEYESNVTMGTANDTEAHMAEMQAMVDRSTVSISINATPVWRLSSAEAGVNWQIENPEGQTTKLIRVEIYRDDTGKKIYETGAIRPGTYVSDTPPDVELTEGTYPCTAYFYSYDIETEEFLGKAGAQITLYVLP